MAPTHTDLLRWLWEAYIPEAGSYIDTTPPERQEAALKRLAAHRSEFDLGKEADDLGRMFSALSEGRAVWTLLAVDAAGWLAELPGFPADPKAWTGNERMVLNVRLAGHGEALPPPHRPAIDPIPLLLPRWLFLRLRDALDALDKGEVHSLVAPSIVGRHDEAWTWDEMRARAVEHVKYMHGYGIALQIARKRAGAAMKVSPATIRDWKSDPAFAHRKETAFAAGGYKAALEANPKHCENDGQSVDAHALALFLAIQDEPLAAFGPRYQERFGDRHHTPLSSAGD